MDAASGENTQPRLTTRLTPGSAPRAEPASGLANLAWFSAATGVLVLGATLSIADVDPVVIALVVGFVLILLSVGLLASMAIGEQRRILREHRGLLSELARRLPEDRDPA